MAQTEREHWLGHVQHLWVRTAFPLLNLSTDISPRQGPCHQIGPLLSSEEIRMDLRTFLRVSRVAAAQDQILHRATYMLLA